MCETEQEQRGGGGGGHVRVSRGPVRGNAQAPAIVQSLEREIRMSPE